MPLVKDLHPVIWIYLEDGIPFGKWLVTPIYKPKQGHLEREQPDP